MRGHGGRVKPKCGCVVAKGSACGRGVKIEDEEDDDDDDDDVEAANGMTDDGVAGETETEESVASWGLCGFRRTEEEAFAGLELRVRFTVD